MNMQEMMNDMADDVSYALVDYSYPRVIEWFMNFEEAKQVGDLINSFTDKDKYPTLGRKLCIIGDKKIFALNGVRCVFNKGEKELDVFNEFVFSPEEE